VPYHTGLSRKMAREMGDVINPLYNTCYTRLQLLEIAIEYALEIYEKVLAPGKAYWVDTPLTDTWTPNATLAHHRGVVKQTLTHLISLMWSIVKNKQFARPHKIPKFQLASKSITSDGYYNTCFSGAIFTRAS